VTTPDGGTLARAKVQVVLELVGADSMETRIKSAVRRAEKQIKKSFNGAERAAQKNARAIAVAFEVAAERAERALNKLRNNEFLVKVDIVDGEGNPLSSRSSGKSEAISSLEKQLRDLEKGRKAAIEIDPEIDLRTFDAELAKLRAKVLKERATTGGIAIPVKIDFERNALERAFESIRGSLNKLGDRFDSVKARITAFGDRFDGVGRKLTKVGKVAGGLFGVLGKGAGALGKFESAFGKVAGIATLVVGAIGLVGGSVAALLSSVVPLVGAIELLSGALGVLPAILGAVGAGAATLVIGFQGIGEALKQAKLAAASGDTKKLDEALKNLAPSARDTVKQFLALGPAFTALRLRVQQTLFTGLAGTVKLLGTKLLPVLSDGFTALAAQFSEGAKIFGEGLVSPKSLDDTASIFRNLRNTLKALLPAIDPIRRAITDVVTVGSAQLPSLATSLTKVSEKIAASIDAARKSGALDAFFKRGIEAAKQLGRILGNIGGIFGGIGRAARGAGAGFLNTLERTTQAFEDFTKSATGQNALGNFFASLTKTAQAFAPVLKQIAVTIGTQLAPSFAAIADHLGPALVAVVRSIGDIVVAATPGLTKFADALSRAFNNPAIQAGFTQIGKLLGEAFAGIGEQAQPLILALQQILAAVLPLVPPLARLAAIVADVIADLATAIAPSLPGVLKTIGEAVAAVAPGLIAFVKAFFEALADPQLRKTIVDLFTFLGGALQTLAPLVGPVVDIVARLAGAFVNVANAIGPLPVLLLGLGVVIAGLAGGPIGLLIFAFAGLVTVLATKVFPALATLIDTLESKLPVPVQHAVLLISNAGTIIGGVFDRMNGKAEETGAVFKDSTGKMNDGLFSVGRAVKTALADVNKGFNDMAAAAGRTADLFGAAGAEAGSGFAAGLRAQLSNLNFDVNLKVNAHIVGPAIPSFMAGGVIDSPTLANVGEQGKREVVLPLTNPLRLRTLLADPRVAGPVAAAQGSGGGATINQNFELHTPRVDDRALAAMVSTRLLAGLR
jgi:phage-related protein